MANYIDGYFFPIKRIHLEEYKAAAVKIAEIWKEHGALAYVEYVSDGFKMDGIRSFPEILNNDEDESVVFGWIAFESKKARDLIHEKVAIDTRMNDLVSPLMDPARIIFDAKQMVYGGFEPLIEVS